MVVPFDNSPCAERALARAAFLALAQFEVFSRIVSREQAIVGGLPRWRDAARALDIRLTERAA